MPQRFVHIDDENFIEEYGELTKKEVLEELWWMKDKESRELNSYKNTWWFNTIGAIAFFFAIFGFLGMLQRFGWIEFKLGGWG